MKIKALEDSEILDSMGLIPSWKMLHPENNKTQSIISRGIIREFSFPDFRTALEFVNIVGDLAEALNHHPDITLGWGKVSICLSTHSIKAISELDIELARRIDTSFTKFKELKS